MSLAARRRLPLQRSVYPAQRDPVVKPDSKLGGSDTPLEAPLPGRQPPQLSRLAGGGAESKLYLRAAPPPQAGGRSPKPCSRLCGFRITWHKTHCCNRCELGTGHGPKCDKVGMHPDSAKVKPTLHAVPAMRAAVRVPGELSFGVRGDSFLSTRSVSKNKSTKNFKAAFENEFLRCFGKCSLDYSLCSGMKVQSVTNFISKGPSFDVLCVAVGINDLMRTATAVVQTWPVNLDICLQDLAAAIRQKSKASVVLVGGPSKFWSYDPIWDEYMARARAVLEAAGACVLSERTTDEALKGMTLSSDKLHFANDPGEKEHFAKLWAQWLNQYAGLRIKGQPSAAMVPQEAPASSEVGAACKSELLGDRGRSRSRSPRLQNSAFVITSAGVSTG